MIMIQWLFQADHIAAIAAIVAAVAAIIAIIFARRSMRICSEIISSLRD